MGTPLKSTVWAQLKLEPLIPQCSGFNPKSPWQTCKYCSMYLALRWSPYDLSDKFRKCTSPLIPMLTSFPGLCPVSYFWWPKACQDFRNSLWKASFWYLQLGSVEKTIKCELKKMKVFFSNDKEQKWTPKRTWDPLQCPPHKLLEVWSTWEGHVFAPLPFKVAYWPRKWLNQATVFLGGNVTSFPKRPWEEQEITH